MKHENFNIGDIIDTVSEKEKEEIPYLKGNIDHAIAHLVYYKEWEENAYNIYWGKRDTRALQHLTDNYGVGSPIDIPNMRLMAGRINRLIGKALQNHLDYHVTCSNSSGIDFKMQEKKIKILQEIEKETKKNADANRKILAQYKTPEGEPIPLKEVIGDDFLKSLRMKFGESWQADFEIAAQDFLKHIVDRKEILLKSGEWFKDATIVGQMFSRVFVREEGKLPEVWKIDPENFFYERSYESSWIKDCRRVVYRRYMTGTEILNELGHLINKEDHEKIAKAVNGFYSSPRTQETVVFNADSGEDIAFSKSPRYQEELIEVFHVEWVASNEDKSSNSNTLDLVSSKNKNIKVKTKRRLDRYEGYYISISGGIYCGMGKSKYIVRSQDDPTHCGLTYNGYVFGKFRSNVMHKSGDRIRDVHFEPFSLIMATANLNDLYDITHFHLNNLMASARPGGTITVLEHIPKEFGNTPEERILKSMAYEKTLSQKIISLSSQGLNPGEPGAIPFNNYGQYSSNLDGQILQAFISYIDNLEQQADRMLGLNPQMMGEVEERSGKGVTMQAIQQAELLTKELFRIHSIFMRQILTETLNIARLALPDGYYGAIALGENQRIFKIDAEIASIADFNVFITDDYEESVELAKADEIVLSAIQSGAAPLKSALDVILSRSVSGKKRILERAEQEQEGGAKQQLEETSAQLEEMQKELEKLQKENEELKKKQQDNSLKEKQLELQAKKIELDSNHRSRELQAKEKQENEKRQIEKKELEAEIFQMFDNNPRNDKINKNR